MSKDIDDLYKEIMNIKKSLNQTDSHKDILDIKKLLNIWVKKFKKL